MTEEDFIAWRDSAATQWFMGAMAQAAEDHEKAVKDYAWFKSCEGAEIDPAILAKWATKAQTYRDMTQATFTGLQSYYEEVE